MVCVRVFLNPHHREESQWTPVCLRPNLEVGRERHPIYSPSSCAGTWDDEGSNCEGPSPASSEGPCCSSVTSWTTFWGHFLGRPRGRRSPTGSAFFSAVLGPLFLLPFGRPLGRFGVGGPTGSCCCLRGRPRPLRWGSGGDRAALGSGDGSLVPLSLMPASVHLLQRVWASKPKGAASRAWVGLQLLPEVHTVSSRCARAQLRKC